MVKHTPGPWNVYEPRYANSGQVQIRDEADEIIIAAIPEKGNRARALADGRLIAKAPELREALLTIHALSQIDVDEAEHALEALADIRETARALLAAIDGTPEDRS